MMIIISFSNLILTNSRSGDFFGKTGPTITDGAYGISCKSHISPSVNNSIYS